MTLDLYLAFVVAATLLIVTPGPSVMVVISHALSYNLRRAWLTIGGIAASHILFLSITSLGLVTLLMASTAIFGWLKWLGAAYLIWQGFKQWRTIHLPVEMGEATSIQAGWSLFLQGFAVNSTNPHALVFYAAFFPPFMDPARPILPQLLIMSMTFITILVLISYLYAWAAAQSQSWFSGMKQAHLQSRITGLLLILAGVILMTATP